MNMLPLQINHENVFYERAAKTIDFMLCCNAAGAPDLSLDDDDVCPMSPFSVTSVVASLTPPTVLVDALKDPPSDRSGLYQEEETELRALRNIKNHQDAFSSR